MPQIKVMNGVARLGNKIVAYTGDALDHSSNKKIGCASIHQATPSGGTQANSIRVTGDPRNMRKMIRGY